MNTGDGTEMFSYLDDSTAIRFHKKISPIPNMKIKFAKKKFDKNTLEDRVKVVMGKNKIFIPSIEEQIVYKRIILGSDKDKEDARHLEEIFKNKIDKNKLVMIEKSVRSGAHEF